MSRCGSGKSMLVNSILGDDIVTQGDHHYSISYSLADTNLILKELDPQNIEIFKQVCLDAKNTVANFREYVPWLTNGYDGYKNMATWMHVHTGLLLNDPAS